METVTVVVGRAGERSVYIELADRTRRRGASPQPQGGGHRALPIVHCRAVRTPSWLKRERLNEGGPNLGFALFEKQPGSVGMKMRVSSSPSSMPLRLIKARI